MRFPLNFILKLVSVIQIEYWISVLTYHSDMLRQVSPIIINKQSHCHSSTLDKIYRQ